MTRILFDNRPSSATATGIGRYASSLASLLQDSSPWKLRVLSELKIGDFTDRAWQEFSLPRLLWETQVDIYHSPLFRLPAVMPCASVVTLHDAIPAARPDLTPASFRRFFEEEAAESAHRADLVVCPSAHARNDVCRALDLPHEACHVVPEAPDPIFRELPAAERDLARGSVGAAGGYVLVVGSAEPRKNPLAVLDALRALNSRGPKLSAVFAGGSGPVDLSHEAATRGLSDRVQILGTVPDAKLVELYNAATAVVVPSRYEGFGLPVVEAFACGAPVISSNASALPEVGGDAALYFDPETPLELAACLEELLQSEGLADQLCARGRQRLQEAFSPRHVLKAVDQAYAHALQAVAS